MVAQIGPGCDICWDRKSPRVLDLAERGVLVLVPLTDVLPSTRVKVG